MNKLTEEQIQEIIAKYNAREFNGAQLGRIYGFSTTTINNMLHRRGANILTSSERARKYPVDETFFDEIDSQEKAYFLGLLFSDGTVSGGSIMISLQDKDIDILEKLRDLIQPTKPLLWYKNKNPKRQDTSRLTISNEKIRKRLNELGMVPNKTFKLKFPDFLREDLIRHFIRGYLDGDGSINSNGGSCNIVATLDFCNSMRDILSNQLGINSSIIIPNIRDITPIRRITVNGRNNARKFLNWIYEGATIYMERKYQSYLKLVNFKRGSHGKPLLIHPDGTKFTEDEKRERANAIRRGDYSFDFLKKMNRPSQEN